MIAEVGEAAYALFYELRYMLYLLSESVYWSTLGRFDKMRLPFKGAFSLQMIRLGSTATTIVFMLSFLIGLTLAFQSAVQLELLGAGVFLVEALRLPCLWKLALL